jgi:hypothetical protein
VGTCLFGIAAIIICLGGNLWVRHCLFFTYIACCYSLVNCYCDGVLYCTEMIEM